MADEVLLSGGKLVHAKIVDKITSKIEKGSLTSVSALIVHQTGGTTAESALNSYADGTNGAHFLIDKDGTIYQTARIDQKCWHVGKVRSRCYELKTCTTEELKTVKALLFKKGEAYHARVKKLHDHEAEKSYPDRYPTNDDSLGIEIVSAFDGKAYEAVNKEQNDALAWLVDVLEAKLSLGTSDVYTHGTVAYKQETEASTAQWAH